MSSKAYCTIVLKENREVLLIHKDILGSILRILLLISRIFTGRRINKVYLEL
jgi:hypothetical protein